MAPGLRVPGRRRGGVAAVLLVSLLLAGCGPGSEPLPLDGDPFAEVEMVEIPLDESDGREVSLARNFYFIFDGSYSMTERTDEGCQGDQRFGSKLEGAQWAVHRFLDTVPDEVNLGLYLFDRERKEEVLPLGLDNRDRFLELIDGVDAGRGTPLAAAIGVGTERLVEQYRYQLGYGEFRLIVVTDGQAAGIPRAARRAASFGIPIYAIGLCVGEEHALRQYAVSYRAADNFEDLAVALEETLAELPSYDVTEFEETAAPEAGPGADMEDELEEGP